MDAVANTINAGHPYARPHPSLTPPDQYREMAQGVLANSQHILDFLSRCQACGLPVESRIQEVQDHCTFCQAFLHNFYPEV